MSIRINVDPTNPGQFFACCGLLELADRLWQQAEGWFAEGQFHIACEGKLNQLLSILVRNPPEELTTLDNGMEVKPLVAPLRFSFDDGATSNLTLDTWMTIKIDRGKPVATGNPPWNFWSGQQTSLQIWLYLRQALVKQLQQISSDQFESLFSQRVLLSGRFGFDPGAAWNALDVGFSPNEQKMSVASSAAVELLAAIGIQRFRPVLAKNHRSFTYATWGQKLPLSVASAAACGAILVPPALPFLGRVVSRGSYTALAYSIPIQGEKV